MAEESKDLIPMPASRDPPDRRGVAVDRLAGAAPGSRRTPLTRPQVPPDLPDMPVLVGLHACLRLFLLDGKTRRVARRAPARHLHGGCSRQLRAGDSVAVPDPPAAVGA